MFYVVVYVEVSCEEFVSEQQLSTEHYNAESGDINTWSIKRCGDTAHVPHHRCMTVYPYSDTTNRTPER